MPKLEMTDKAVAKIKAPTVGQVDYFDIHIPAFGFRVGVSGVKTWIVSTKVLRLGEWLPPRRIAIGRYPAMSLADARIAARKALTLAAEGKDPTAVAAANKAEIVDASRNTFGAMADKFLESYIGRGKRRPRGASMLQCRVALKGTAAAKDTDGNPRLKRKRTPSPVEAWQDRPVSSITQDDVADLLAAIVERGNPVAANRALIYLRVFFKWCSKPPRRLIKIIPTDGLEAPGVEAKRDRVLSDAEIREVWAGAEAIGGHFAAVFKLLLLTGQRRNEITALAEAELKGANTPEPVLDLPGDRTKNGVPHLVPLAPQAVAILNSVPRILDCQYVFSTTGKTPVSGFGRAKERLDASIQEARQKAAPAAPEGQALEVEPMKPWRLHDLRRTAATGMGELGIQPHIIEAILNHVSGHRAGVAGTYNKAVYRDEKRKALELWANHVDKIVGNNVIVLRSA